MPTIIAKSEIFDMLQTMVLLCAGVGSTLELDRHRFNNNH